MDPLCLHLLTKETMKMYSHINTNTQNVHHFHCTYVS